MLSVICDADNRILRVNREFLNQVYAVESEVLGRPLAQFLAWEPAPPGSGPTDTRRARLTNRYGQEVVVSVEVSAFLPDRPEAQFLPGENQSSRTLGLETLPAGQRPAIRLSIYVGHLETLPGWQCLNSIEGAVLTEDRDGFITFANTRLLDLLGFDAGELVGKHWTEIVPADCRPDVAQQLRTRPRGTRSQYDTFILTKTGRRIPVIVSARPVFDDREYEGTVSDFTDITERMKIEAELRLVSETKSEFVAAVSHDLRAPLTTIIEGIRLVYDGVLGPVNDEQREHLLMAWEDSVRLNEFIDDLLDVQKIERGKLEPVPARVNLAEAIARILRPYRSYIDEHGLTLTLELPAAPQFAWCDPGHYRRILTNLLSNAVKFTPKGGRLHVKVETDPAGMLRTSVRDTGIGIAQDQQHRIFGRFEQVRSAETAAISGTGLGLWLCRQLVELNGGRIGFESAERQGSTFYFTLPAGDDTSN